jgi:hypothetical protein
MPYQGLRAALASNRGAVGVSVRHMQGFHSSTRPALRLQKGLILRRMTAEGVALHLP